MVFLLILDVLGNFGHFIGLFWSFERFQGYFSNLLGFGGIFIILEVLILVIFKVSRIFCSYEKFQVYFGLDGGILVIFRGFECILLIFEISMVFWLF